MLPKLQIFKGFVLIFWVLTLPACEPGGERSVALQFVARAQGQDIDCGTGDRHQVGDFRLYVSNTELILANGTEHPIALDQDTAWQHQDVALLAFVSPDCDAERGLGVNRRIVGHVQGEDFVGLKFDIGVPFDLNHVNPVTAAPPLNIGSLFWTWQQGYKFLRLDLTAGDNAASFWSLHLGSTGCQSPSSVRAPTQECDRPHRVEIRLNDFNPQTSEVVIDLDQLLSGIELSEGHCMGMFHQKPHCSDILRRFGIDAETGRCTGQCNNKSVIYARIRDLQTAVSQ